jgi:hypothetical protein
MPAVSKKQFKLMKMVETGQTTLPGMSKKKQRNILKVMWVENDLVD